MTERVGLWGRLPEWVRWILFVPTILVLLALANLLALFVLDWAAPGPGWGWFSRWWRALVIPVAQAGASAPAFFALVFELAPRKKRVVGWCAYLVTMTLVLAAVALLVFRAVLTLGLFKPRLPPPEDIVGWDVTVSGELVGAIAWAIAGTAEFFELLRKHRDRERGLRT